MNELGNYFVKCIITVLAFGGLSFILVLTIGCILVLIRKHHAEQSENMSKSLDAYRTFLTELRNGNRDLDNKHFN